MSSSHFNKNNSNTSTKNSDSHKQVTKYTSFNAQDAAIVLSKKIQLIVKENKDIDEQELRIQNKTPFYCNKLPKVSIMVYLLRLIKLSKAEYSTVVLTGILLDRFCDNLEFHLTKYNVFR